jgi:hypothetical protein
MTLDLAAINIAMVDCELAKDAPAASPANPVFAAHAFLFRRARMCWLAGDFRRAEGLYDAGLNGIARQWARAGANA